MDGGHSPQRYYVCASAIVLIRRYGERSRGWYDAPHSEGALLPLQGRLVPLTFLLTHSLTHLLPLPFLPSHWVASGSAVGGGAAEWPDEVLCRPRSSQGPLHHRLSARETLGVRLIATLIGSMIVAHDLSDNLCDCDVTFRSFLSLRPFHQRPFDDNVTDAHLVLWYIEDQIKAKYNDFITIIEVDHGRFDFYEFGSRITFCADLNFRMAPMTSWILSRNLLLNSSWTC